MKRNLFLSLGLLLLAGWVAAEDVFPPAESAPVRPNESERSAFFRDLAETRNFTLGRPVSATPTPDGRAVIFLRGGARDPVLRLYELDVSTGLEREIITPEQILGGAAEVLSPEEKARRERSRTTLRGITTFDLSDDGARLLVVLSGRLYVVERSDLSVTELPGENWIAPRFSPNGAFVAAVRGGELHVIDLATRTVRTLTTGANEVISHGVAEFIAQEEMERTEGFWWSPDSEALAYQETDNSALEVRYIADPLNPTAEPQKLRYPRAGTANSKVRLGLISRDGGATRWVSWDIKAFPYLARVIWKEPEAPLTLLVQERRQRDERLLAVDTATGATRELLRETDAAWVNLDGDVPVPMWLNGGRQFLWTTERRGFWQVELRDAAGALVREITLIDFGYRRIVGLDAANEFVYVAGAANPTETQLWKFPLAGGPGLQLTTGRGVHSGRLSKSGNVLVHSFELIDGSFGVEVLSADGVKLANLKSVAETPPSWPNVELTRTPGEPSFHAAIVRPRDFRAGTKYPVILYVYGGPQITVVRATASSYVIDQWLADQGYIVARLDGRGTPLRGRDWQRQMYGNFIDLALHDQVEGLRALGGMYPEMDLTRVGVHGWSFGGYFSAMAVLRRPDVFKAGIAGAPVVTWENYDTYYTERYMGLMDENPAGYGASSVLSYASALERPLLLIHGLTDDNVYAQHTLQLADTFFMVGKPYEFMPMLGTHLASSSDPLVRQRMYERLLEFFERTVK